MDTTMIGIIVFIAICVIGLGFVIVMAVSTSEECARDPFLYGAISYNEVSGNDVICSCTTTDIEVESFTFSQTGYSGQSNPFAE